MAGGGPRPGHAPTNGLAKEIWDMSDEEIDAIFGDAGEADDV